MPRTIAFTNLRRFIYKTMFSVCASPAEMLAKLMVTRSGTPVDFHTNAFINDDCNFDNLQHFHGFLNKKLIEEALGIAKLYHDDNNIIFLNF